MKEEEFDGHLDEVDYLVVDVETTGLSAERGDRVCEMGAVRLRGGAIVETYGTLINPEQPVSAGAFAVNGISPAMLEGAPFFSDVAAKIEDLMEKSIIVAYNAPFDLSFLRSEFRLAGRDGFSNQVVDALSLARQILPGLQSYRQENVARIAGVSFPVRHRALEDATVTAQLFTIFGSIMKAHRCNKVSDLVRRDLGSALHVYRIGIVESALESKKNLWIKYLSPFNGEITDRIISPKEYFTDQIGKYRGAYLIAHCHTAREERNFRIDRILDMRLM